MYKDQQVDLIAGPFFGKINKFMPMLDDVCKDKQADTIA
jgi:hypothetical protein